MNADCGNINLMHNGGNDLAIFDMGSSHPNSEKLCPIFAQENATLRMLMLLHLVIISKFLYRRDR